MRGFIGSLASGSWLTRERARLWALAVLIASLGGLAYLLATSDGLNDYQGRPLGTDFSNVYAAGTLVLDGTPEAPFDPPRQHAREKQIFGDATPFYGWHYPPFFLFVAALLALMPYPLALLAWQGATLALYLMAVRAILAGAGPQTGAPPQSSAPAASPHPDPLWVLAALAFPAVFINIGHGHNGFLTAALLAGALVRLDRRPLLAGALFGLLAYKPQFGIMIPLVLLATGRWRAVAGAVLAVAALALATTLAFGPDVWRAFLASTHFTRIVVLEDGNTGWHKIQSVFAWVRMWGGPVPLAYAVQGAAMIAIGAALVAVWRSSTAFGTKAALLCLAAILATPYSLDYDLMVLAPAIAFLACDGLRGGLGRYEATALALLWLMPLVARTAAHQALLPLGVTAMLAVFALVVRRAVAAGGKPFAAPFTALPR